MLKPMNEEIEKEFLEEFLECKQNPEDKHGIVECGSEGLWDWINKKLQQAYLQGAKDMAKAVRLEERTEDVISLYGYDHPSYVEGEEWNEAVDQQRRKAQQFIDSLERKPQ